VSVRIRRLAAWTAGALALAVVAAALVAWFGSGNACDHPAAVRGDAMRAIVHCDYGPPEVLKLETVEKPVPGDGEILVRVRAASLNPLDWHLMRGEPYVGRTTMGLRKPKSTRFGVDFAGTVVAVGSNVTAFGPGDEVFGAKTGALAEFVAVRADRAVVRKPASLTFEQAAAIPVAAVTALQGLRDEGKLKPGQKVLVNGASGGVGTFAVQIAKALGARVTGVCSGRNAELVRSIGADRVIDYTREDFTKGEERYDVVLDNVGNHALSDLRRVLAPGGRYVMVGGPKGRWLDPMPRAIGAALLSRVVRQHMGFFLARLDPADLSFLGELASAGKLTPVVDRRYTLGDVPEAVRYLEAGHARGKVVVAVE